MSFTNVWTLSVPPDTDLAKNIALEQRTTKMDIQERMNSQFVTDWTADPLVIQPQILGNVNNKNSSLAGSCFRENYSTSAYGNANIQNVTRSGVTLNSNTGIISAQVANVFGNILIPNNITITQFGCFISNNNCTLYCKLWYFGGAVGTSTLGNITGIAPGSTQRQFLQNLSFPEAGIVLVMEVGTTDGAAVGQTFSLVAGYVSYTTPDCRSTV